MRRSVIAASALLCLAAIASLASAQAATPTCVAGVKGVAPTATVTFTPPATQSDGTAFPSGTTLTYNLYQGTSSGAEVKVASSSSGSPITVNTGIVGATTYYWYVTVVDANGESAPSNEVCKSFPAPLPGVVTITIQ